MCSLWLLMTVKKKKSALFCLRMHAESRFVSLFVHLWKRTVFLAKVRVEDVTTVSSRGLMSLHGNKRITSKLQGSTYTLCYKDQRIQGSTYPCYRGTVCVGVPKIGRCLECILSLLTEIFLLLLSVAGQRGEDPIRRGSKKAPCEPVVDAIPMAIEISARIDEECKSVLNFLRPGLGTSAGLKGVAPSRSERREENRSILATLPHSNIPLIVIDSTDDEEEEDEDENLRELDTAQQHNI
jgi:hypothetical protein